MVASFFAILIGGIIPASTQTGYYVSAAGNDSNPGTLAAPWATMSKANAHTYAPDDTLNFRGGDSFSGNLVLQFSSPPSASHRFTVQSYGTGQAMISAGDGDGIKFVDVGSVTVTNLNFVGSGFTINSGVLSTTSTGYGVHYLTTTASTTYPGVVISNNTITGFINGVYVRNSNTSCTTATSGCQVTGNYIHDCVENGVYFTGHGAAGDLVGQIFEASLISACEVRNIPGHGTEGGMPLRLYNCSNSSIERCLTAHNGYIGTGGCVAILLVNSTNIGVRYCDISDFFSQGSDGHGIDPDLNCFDTIVEYNYVHDAGRTGLYNFAGIRTLFRYNIVENCDGGYVSVSGSATCYNNTFYNNTTRATIETGGSDAFYNNIIMTKAGTKMALFSTGTQMIGNTYWAIGNGGTFLTTVSGTDYSSLSAFRTAGYEKQSSTNYGVNGNPNFANAGGGTTQLMTNQVSHLAAYDLTSGSAAQGAAIDWTAVGLTAPTLDWHGNAATTGTFDSGAVRFGSN